mmetsp:Transcript_3305/g.4417  ORF Transcript_3305/g.4417 Transcript_3305/m.4417 type:complete len:259 (-) Transcript_3305:2319-3095(-)
MSVSPVQYNVPPGSGPIDKVRILVVGDSGTGKTSLIHRLCFGKSLTTTSWTVGCHVEVKLHTCKLEGQERNFFIEFWEVGGHRNFEPGRHIFYRKLNGIMLVYDLKNLKSFHNLRSWISELAKVSKSSRNGIAEPDFAITASSYAFGTNSSSAADVLLRSNAHAFSDNSTSNRDLKLDIDQETENKQQYIRRTFGNMPILIVGNKADLIRGASLSAPPSTKQTYGIQSINLSSLKAEMDKLSPFFQRVIEQRFSQTGR